MFPQNCRNRPEVDWRTPLVEHVAVGVAGYAHVQREREWDTDTKIERHTHTDTRHYPRHSLKHTNLHKTHKNNTLTIPPIQRLHRYIRALHTHTNIWRTHSHTSPWLMHIKLAKILLFIYFFMLETLNCKLFACLPATNVKLGSQGGGEREREKNLAFQRDTIQFWQKEWGGC